MNYKDDKWCEKKTKNIKGNLPNIYASVWMRGVRERFHNEIVMNLDIKDELS